MARWYFAAAATSRVDGKGVDAAVCYYGSAINGMLAMVGGIDCPVMYHYGDADDFIAPESIEEVERGLVAVCPGVEFHRYPAPAGGMRSATGMRRPCTTSRRPKPRGVRTLAFLDQHLR